MYEADDVFRDIRSGYYPIPEGKSQLTGAAKAKADYKRGIERIEEHRPYFDKVISIQPIAKALLGDKVLEKLKDILQLRMEIITAFAGRLNYNVSNEKGESDQTDNQQPRNELWDIAHGAFDDKDEFYQQYKAALNSLEDKLLPLIRGEA